LQKEEVMELGKVERNQYGNEYVYIDFYGKTFKFRVDDVYEETEELTQVNQKEKDRKFLNTRTILKLEEV
jgi:hypothetical protein